MDTDAPSQAAVRGEGLGALTTCRCSYRLTEIWGWFTYKALPGHFRLYLNNLGSIWEAESCFLGNTHPHTYTHTALMKLFIDSFTFYKLPWLYVLIFQGCHNIVPPPGWLKQQKLVSPFWRRQVWDKGMSRAGSFWGWGGGSALWTPLAPPPPNHVWQFSGNCWNSLACGSLSPICLHLRMTFLCVSVSKLLLLMRKPVRSEYWILTF